MAREMKVMEVCQIDQFALGDLAEGARGKMWLEVSDGLIEPVRLPLLYARGGATGPTLLVVAGVHGDEYEGMEAIRQVAATLDPARMNGALLGIPIANPFAYEARARVTPLHLDGLNLARVFPGDRTGSPTRRLAAALLDLVMRNLDERDLFLDFHSGSADAAYATLIGFRDVPGPVTAAAEEAARHFGLDRLWRIPDAPGPFNAETARRGIVTLGTETTGRAGCAAADVAAFAEGLTNLLAYLGILPELPRPARYAGPARTTIDVVAPASGFLRGARLLADEVVAGEPLGTLITLFGDPIAELRAPIAGTIWAARTMPPVRTGELVYMIAERV